MKSTWNFIKNNKKSIFFTTSAIVGFIGLRRYLSSMEKQWQTSQSKNFVAEVRKKGQYFDESLSIGNEMSNKQFKLIIKKLKQFFRIESLLNKIKDAQKNKVTPTEQLKYYEELKIEIISYIVSEIYVITIFITYLRIQLSMISGIMYHENQIKSNNSPKSDLLQLNNNNDGKSRYYMFISLIENYHRFGVEHLVNYIRSLINKFFNNNDNDKWNILNEINLNDFYNQLNLVKQQFNDSFDEILMENILIVYRNSSNNNVDINNSNELLNEYKACQKFIDEFIDITKLTDFSHVIKQCLDIGYSNLFDFINELFIQHHEQSKQIDKQFINPYDINLVLLKLLPLIWKQVHNSDSNHCESMMMMSSNEFLNNGKNDNNQQQRNRNALLVQYLLCSDSLTCFAANIYEAFCNEMLPTQSLFT